MAYGDSNGHMTDDVTWPRKVKSWPQYAYSAISRNLLNLLQKNYSTDTLVLFALMLSQIPSPYHKHRPN